MPRRAVNTFKPPTWADTAPSQNREGYPADVRPIEERYLQTLMTNTLGAVYYASKKELVEESKSIHTEMLAKDPQYAAKALVYARQKGYMRTQTIYGLARLSAASPQLAASIFDSIINTPNDLSDFTSIIGSLRTTNPKTRAAQVRVGLPGELPSPGRAMKEAGGRWLVKNLSEYWAIKYGAALATKPKRWSG